MTPSFYDYLRGFPMLTMRLSGEGKVVSVVGAILEILGRCCGAVEVMRPDCEVHLISVGQ